MAGFVPAIHVFLSHKKDVDARHKAGRDEGVGRSAASTQRSQLTPSLRSPCLIAGGNSTTGLEPWIWKTGGSSELIWPLAPNFTGPKKLTTSSLASSSRTLSRSRLSAFSIAIWNSAPHSAADACP